MAASAVVDAGFLIALLHRRDRHHRWAADQGERNPPPWATCEAVISEAAHVLGRAGQRSLTALLQRDALVCSFRFAENQDAVLGLLEKYASVPMSFADACLVRMTEILDEPLLLTADSDFRIYRRHGRRVVPCVLPRE